MKRLDFPSKSPYVEACGWYHEDKDVPGYCEGCHQPKENHSEKAIEGPSWGELGYKSKDVV